MHSLDGARCKRTGLLAVAVEAAAVPMCQGSVSKPPPLCCRCFYLRRLRRSDTSGAICSRRSPTVRDKLMW
jgi:hypothetical protein